MDHYNELLDAAKINRTYKLTKNREVGLALHQALYDLLEAMLGKKADKWVSGDLDAIEVAAKQICCVFDVGMSMERDEPLFWDLNP